MDSNSPQAQAYLDFVEALENGDDERVRSFVDETRFVAHIPGGPEEGLDIAGFLEAFKRFWAPFSDFGADTTYLHFSEDPPHLTVLYSVRVTQDGPLDGWWGCQSIAPTGARVALTCVDLAAFNAEGRIFDLIMMWDRLSVLEQVRGAS